MAATPIEDLKSRILDGTITAAKVAMAPEHLATLPYRAGGDCVMIERAVFDMLRGLSPDYDGGLWEYFQLSNGGFYMAPKKKGLYTIVYEGIGFSGTVSAEAAGIIACAMTFSHLSFVVQGDRCVRAYELLLDFVVPHPDAKMIRAALN